MRKLALLWISFLWVGWLGAAGGDLDCFTVVVGKKASADGSVLVAHNEDDSGRLLVNVIKVPARQYRRGDFFLLKNGVQIPQPGSSAGMLWLEIPGSDFADSYLSENGVSVTSNSCPSREDRGELSDGGIGFSLRRLIAERARTAREGVRIAGDLIARFGYNASGRTYVIADSGEGWLLHAMRGKRWVARRVPDNEVAVVANRYVITQVSLDDPENFLGSPDIVEYAQRRGWHDPGQETPFDFARACSDPASYSHPGNVMRQWRGIDLLASRTVKPDAAFPFSFKPRRDLRPRDLFRVLRDHYEGTKYDLSSRYRHGTPNSSGNRTICTESTQYAFVAHLRSGLPAEIAAVLWIAPRRPDSNAFSPWYASMESVPRGSSREGPESSWKDHFAPLPAQVFENPGLSFNTYARLADAVDRQYRGRIEKALKIWRNFEEFLFDDLRDHEKEFAFLLKNQRDLALRIIENYLHGLEYRKWFLASDLLKEMR